MANVEIFDIFGINQHFRTKILITLSCHMSSTLTLLQEGEREREKERKRGRDRQTDRQTDRQRNMFTQFQKINQTLFRHFIVRITTFHKWLCCRPLKYNCQNRALAPHIQRERLTTMLTILRAWGQTLIIIAPIIVQ